MNAPPPELPEGLVFEQFLAFNEKYLIRQVRDPEGEGELSNPCGPAYEKFCADTGHIIQREFILDGQFHNENGPASELYYHSGVCNVLEWFVRGKRHNPYGPAVLKFATGGELYKIRFFLNDNEVDTEEQFLALTMATKSAGKK